MVKTICALIILCTFIMEQAFCGGISGDTKMVSSAGMKFIANSQNEDGSYGKGKDIANSTAIVLYTLASGGRKYSYNSGPFVSRAVDYLLARQKPDGGFGSYEATCNAVLALKILDERVYAGEIAKAIGHLESYNVDGGYWNFFGLKLPGEKLSVFEEAQQAVEGKSLKLAESSIKAIMSNQELDAASPASFGEVKNIGAGVYADSLVATALACLAADNINSCVSLLK